MHESFVTRDGQITIPPQVRQQFGINTGSRVSFHVVDNRIELWVSNPPVETLESGFGMLKSTKKAVPADFDPAPLLTS